MGRRLECFICGSERTDDHSYIIYQEDGEILGSAHRLDYGRDSGYWRLIATYPRQRPRYFVGSCFKTAGEAETWLKVREKRDNL